jgi:hypothetical protein
MQKDLPDDLAELDSQLFFTQLLGMVEALSEGILQGGMTDFMGVIADLQEIVLMPFYKKMTLNHRNKMLRYYMLFFSKQIRPKKMVYKKRLASSSMV